MRLISPKEYAKIKGYRSVSTVYKLMRDKKLPFTTATMEVKRIPWDDDVQDTVPPQPVPKKQIPFISLHVKSI